MEYQSTFIVLNRKMWHRDCKRAYINQNKMNLAANTEINSNDVVTVMLALLDKDLQEMMTYCMKHQWRYEMLNSNNLQLYIPRNSLHLLFYLGYQVLSGSKTILE